MNKQYANNSAQELEREVESVRERCKIHGSPEMAYLKKCKRKMRIVRIIQWIIVILATALIFYIVITEERLAPEGWGF